MADVSESLIFRHYVNKEGLLQAILYRGKVALNEVFADILNEEHPPLVIEKTLDMVQKLQQHPDKARFWKLHYKIKWEMDRYDAGKLPTILDKLTHAFGALGHPNPPAAAQRLLIELDGIAMRFFLDPSFKLHETITYLKQSYLK